MNSKLILILPFLLIITSCSLMPAIAKKKIKKNPKAYIPTTIPKQTWKVTIDASGQSKKYLKYAQNLINRKYYGNFILSDKDTLFDKPYVDGDPNRYIIKFVYSNSTNYTSQGATYHQQYDNWMHDRKTGKDYKVLHLYSLGELMKVWYKMLNYIY